MIFKRLCGVVDRVHGLDYIISKYLTPWHTLVQKYLNVSGLTMNPGAPWMSSVGTVSSRMAASANTSSTIGIARVKRWAMWWKWAVSLLCGRDGNLSLGLIARGEKSGFLVHRCYRSLRVIHASPPARLVCYISLELAEPEFEFTFLLRGADPSPNLFAQRMKATPRLLLLWREKCFYLSLNCCTNCCSFAFWAVCTPKLIGVGGGMMIHSDCHGVWWQRSRLLHPRT